MMSTSSSLPTAPIGKQQVIDLKAGAILRENARRSGLFFGCPLPVVLVIIAFAKCAFISFWIIREYDSFDFRCTSWNDAAADGMYRAKRWALFENSDPRAFPKTPEDDEKAGSEVVVKKKKKQSPLYGASRRTYDPSSDPPPPPAPPNIDPNLDFGPLPPTFQRRFESNRIPDPDDSASDDVGDVDDDDLPMTTMVTLTNTQLIPLTGEDHGVVKMKTIRNRMERVGSAEEQFIEIDIENAPRIYVSKIKSRHGGDQNETFDLLGELRNDKKTEKEGKKKTKGKKGKGLKKARKLAAAMNNNSTTPSSEDVTKKRKGGKKQQKKPSKADEVTKQPRHLVGKATSSMGRTTPNPHASSWINGVLDPQDPGFSNQGHVRGYPMQKASRLPVPAATTQMTSSASSSSSDRPSSSVVTTTSEEKEQLKISDSTRMMWDMDELKYTTFLAPKTTEQTRPEVVGEQKEHETETETTTRSAPSTTSTEKTLPGGMSRDEWQQRKEAFEAYQPNVAKSELQPATSPSREEEKEEEPFHVFLPAASTSTTSSPFAQFPFYHASEAPYFVEVNEADTETIYVKDVTPMFRNVLSARNSETTTRPYDPQHLETELAKLKESAVCLGRMAFDIWCLFVLFSSVPFFMGICVPRWSLFVLHIVFDFLFLVFGFVTSLTITIMSSIMYFLIEEMSSDSLFEFLLVAFVIDIVLILYSIIVGVAYRCCCRLVENSAKDAATNYSVSSNGEPV